MNNVDFLKYPQFPVSSETFQFLQGMLLLTAKVASMGGQNYILDGCLETDTVVQPGTVVVAGEIMPFVGGAKSDNVMIVERKRSVSVYSTLYSNLYAERSLEFGSGAGQIAWSTFVRLPSLLSLQASLLEKASITDVTSALSLKAAAAHTHAISAVSGLDTALAAKANAADVTEALSGKAPSSHQHSMTEITGYKIHKVGSFAVGDLINGQPLTVPLGETISGDYLVIGTMKGKSTVPSRDQQSWCVRELGPTSFKLVVWEDDSWVQDLIFDYIIIKTS